MKRTLFFILSLIMLIVSLTAEQMSENGKAGYTLSPGETACNNTGCHTSFALNSGGGSISATCTMVNWSCDPSTTYTIHIKVAKTGVHLFGFGVEILDYTNHNAGNIIATDAVHTQIMSRTVGGISKRNIVHKLNGGASQDSVIFSFNWTSPASSTSPITMYFAGNATNANGNENGDYIYTSSQVITPTTGNRVDEIIAADPFTVYPNPAIDNISLHYFLPKNENVVVGLYDLKGSLVYLLSNTERMAGENNESIVLPSECRSGLYLLNIESSSGHVCKKLMIN